MRSFPQSASPRCSCWSGLGLEVVYPLDQTCCGQTMANSGCHDDAAGRGSLFVKNFAGFDHIVTPSGSCAHHVREHLNAIPQTADVAEVRRNTYELVEFLHDVLRSRPSPGPSFRTRSACTIGCSTLRQLAHTRKCRRSTARSSRSRSTCSARSTASSSWRRADRTSAAASAALFPCSRSRSPPRWVTTRSTTITTPAPNTSSQPTCPASCIRRAAPNGSGWTSASYISPRS